jgi:excisionase family DNA binding protein
MTEDAAGRSRRNRAQTEALPGEPISIPIAAAVKLTGIGRSTLYEMIKSGDIETVKIGRSTFIRYASLKRLFERSR